MYALKPVIALPETIALPTVMYSLPRILGEEEQQPTTSASGGKTIGGPKSAIVQEAMELGEEEVTANVGRQEPLPEYNLLEHRQMKILDEIFELKAFLETLTVGIRLGVNDLPLEPLKLKDPSKVPVRCAFVNSATDSNQNPVNAEIVVNANPANPPYFILALQRLWKDTKFNVRVHSNSCYGDVNRNAAFEEKLLSSSGDNTVNNIDFTLIWKNVKDVQLIAKVYDFPFEGEANIIRYLARLVGKYNYEKLDAEISNLIDAVLDLCLRVPYEETRYKNATIAKFASYLDKNSWLLNSTNPSIVDVAVWSVLKREASNKIPRELKTWFDLCEKTFLTV